MKVAPTVADIMKGFPKKDYQIDAIPGKPERLALNILIEALRENAASIATKRWRTIWAYGILHVSPPIFNYSTIQHTQPFVMEVPPGELTFVPGDTAAAREDTKLLYYNKVYNFELEKYLTTALKNIIMNKFDKSAYIRLKQQYVGYAGCNVWEFINRLLIIYGEKLDDMVKANL